MINCSTCEFYHDKIHIHCTPCCQRAPCDFLLAQVIRTGLYTRTFQSRTYDPRRNITGSYRCRRHLLRVASSTARTRKKIAPCVGRARNPVEHCASNSAQRDFTPIERTPPPSGGVSASLSHWGEGWVRGARNFFSWGLFTVEIFCSNLRGISPGEIKE